MRPLYGSTNCLRFSVQWASNGIKYRDLFQRLMMRNCLISILRFAAFGFALILCKIAAAGGTNRSGRRQSHLKHGSAVLLLHPMWVVTSNGANTMLSWKWIIHIAIGDDDDDDNDDRVDDSRSCRYIYPAESKQRIQWIKPIHYCSHQANITQ